MTQASPTNNPFAQMAAAARGDIDAQRQLAAEAYQHVLAQLAVAGEAQRAGLEVVLPVQDGIKLTEGLVFARLAASHGGTSDKHLLNGMLSLTEIFLTREAAAEPIAELLARVSLLADQGANGADEYVDANVAHGRPEVVALSQQYRRMILESEEA